MARPTEGDDELYWRETSTKKNNLWLVTSELSQFFRVDYFKANSYQFFVNFVFTGLRVCTTLCVCTVSTWFLVFLASFSRHHERHLTKSGLSCHGCLRCCSRRSYVCFIPTQQPWQQTHCLNKGFKSVVGYYLGWVGLTGKRLSKFTLS